MFPVPTLKWREASEFHNRDDQTPRKRLPGTLWSCLARRAFRAIGFLRPAIQRPVAPSRNRLDVQSRLRKAPRVPALLLLVVS